MTALLLVIAMGLSAGAAMLHSFVLGFLAAPVMVLAFLTQTGRAQRWLLNYSLDRPYFHLGDYQQRYWCLPWWCLTLNTNPDEGGYLPKPWVFIRPRVHIYGRGDRETHLHDHPSDNFTWVLQGMFWEQVPFSKEPSWDAKDSNRPEATKELFRGRDDIVFRRAESRHRIVLSNFRPADEPPLITFFVFGPWRRDWGFTTPNGWVYWRDYLKDWSAS